MPFLFARFAFLRAATFTAAACLISLAFIPGDVARAADVPAEGPKLDQRGRQLIINFKNAATVPEKRLKVAVDIAAAGPAVLQEAEATLEKEVALLQKMAESNKPDPRVEEALGKIRKGLLELRDDKELKEEKLKEVGLPALAQLLSLYGNQQQQMAVVRKRRQDIGQRIEKLQKFLKLVEEQPADQKIALTTGKFGESLKVLSDSLAPTAEELNIAKVFEENAKVARQLDPQEWAGVIATNEIRMAMGLAPLAIDLKLTVASRGHSADMERLKFFAHESPIEEKKTFDKRAELAGGKANGENIYMGSPLGKSAVRGWYLSPGHHKNMLRDSFNRIGLGRHNAHWTELLGN